MKSCLRWAPLAGAILLSACTYGIVLDPGGQDVRVAWNGNVGVRPCRDVGKVTVSVLSRIGPVDRNDIKVRDELEIMARNQAAQMHADTIVPLGEPRNGEQSWEGYACGTVAPSAYSQRPGSGAPVEDVPAYGPPSQAYPPPPPVNAPPPAPFGAPVSGDAQTYPISGGSGGLPR